jgi:hypothetical protein
MIRIFPPFLKSVEDDTLNAKFWKTSEAEPMDWDITATNNSYTQGKIGITVSTNTTFFDDVVVNPLDKIIEGLQRSVKKSKKEIRKYEKKINSFSLTD